MKLNTEVLIIGFRLISIMLGRLRMSTEEALNAYTKITRRIFQKNKRNSSGLLNEDVLVNAIKYFLMELDEDENDGEECMLEERKKEGKAGVGNRYVGYVSYI